ncbi:MAG TPA: heavy metal sensor histidine kinase [Rhodocyclaceae bacterium]|nr:heavy metal sensor histidine kinase [Rhodocyclaceae bacterium]
MRRSITLRLTALFAVASSIVLIAVGSLIGYLVEQHFEVLDYAELQGKVTLLRHSFSELKNGGDLAALPRRLDDALVGQPGISVALRAADDSVFYAHGKSLPNDLWPAPQSLPSDRSIKPLAWEQEGAAFRGMAARVPSGIAGQAPYTALIGLERLHHDMFMAAFTRTLIIAVGLGILLTVALGWAVARSGLAPVRAIAAVAREISAEQLHRRLPLETVPSELSEVVKAFNDMLARLEDSFRRLSDFSSDIAHELRTPVSNLMMQTEVALSKARSADAYREILYSNLEEYERLARMIADMLFIAKAENGLIVPQQETIDLAAEGEQLLEFFAPLADEGSVELVRSGTGTMQGDRLMMRRVLGNLISNAIRHTPTGGKVTLTVEGAGEGLRISVANTGEPIPAEHLPRLFDRFYRADLSRHGSSEGSGLGLAIVKSIVNAHGGEIGVTSVSGLTTFTISLATSHGA